MQTHERVSRLYKVLMVAQAEGTGLGRVYDVYFDKQARRISGFSYKAGPLGTEKESFFRFSDVQKIGRDIIIVSGQAAAQDLPEEVAGCGLRTLKGFPIITSEGRKLGVLWDLIVNRDDGKISEILMTGKMKPQIDIESVVCGPDVIILPVDEVPLVQMETEPDDAPHLFGTATISETVRESFDAIRSSLKNSMNDEKLIETLKSSSIKVRDTVLHASRTIQQAFERSIKREKTDTHPASEESAAPNKNDDPKGPIDDRQDKPE